MADHQIQKGSKLECTHTKMPDPKYNVFGASYNIPQDDIEEFYKLYEDHVFVKGNKEFLTEKQTQDIFVVDFDFRYDSKITSRQHTREQIEDIVEEYLVLLEEYCFFPDPDSEGIRLMTFIMEKPNVNTKSDGKNVTKDGIHMLIAARVDRDIQKTIREKMIKTLPNTSWNNLGIINSWEGVLDEGIAKGSTNWTLYGSRKPGHEAYEVTGYCALHMDMHLSWTYTKDNGGVMIGEELSQLGLSVQCLNFPKLERRDKNAITAGFVEQAKLPPKKRNADEIEDSSSSSSQKVMRTEPTMDATRLAEYQKLEYFFKNGFSSANYEHIDMCNIGYGIKAMFGIEDGLSLYLSVAKKYSENMDWEDEYTKKYEKHMKPKIDWNMGFFMNLFKRLNKELYQKLNKEYTEKNKQDLLAQRKEDILNSGHVHVTDDNDAAEHVLRLLHDKIVYSRGQYFYKNQNIWIHSKPTIDALLMNLILTSELYKYDKERKKETPYGQKVNCAKNIREALYCKIAQAPDDRFYEKFHLTTKGKLAFLDGLLDFQKRMFYTWDEIDFDYYTTQQIKRDFHEYYKNPNREIMELVKSKIYDTAFGEKVDMALHFSAERLLGITKIRTGPLTSEIATAEKVSFMIVS